MPKLVTEFTDETKGIVKLVNKTICYVGADFNGFYHDDGSFTNESRNYVRSGEKVRFDPMDYWEFEVQRGEKRKSIQPFLARLIVELDPYRDFPIRSLHDNNYVNVGTDDESVYLLRRSGLKERLKDGDAVIIMPQETWEYVIES